MVVEKIYVNNTCSSSYDDLDAINDYILACEEDDTSIIAASKESEQGEKTMGYSSVCNELNTNIKAGEESTSKCDFKQENEGLKEDNANVKAINENKEMLAAKRGDFIEKEELSMEKRIDIAGKSSFDLTEQELKDLHENALAGVSTESNIYSVVLFGNEQGSASSLAKVCEMLNEESKVPSSKAIASKVQQERNRYVISKFDKIVECDFNKARLKKLKKSINQANVYELGNVETRHLSNINILKSHARNKNNSQNRNHLPKEYGNENIQEESPSNPLLNTLNIVKIQKVEEDEKKVDISNRYFLGEVPNAIPISEIAEYNDFIGRELYDKLQKKGTSGRITENYVKLLANEFICYRSKQIKRADANPEKSIFLVPYNQEYCYPEKYRVDLKDARLYLVTEKASYCMNWFCCYKSSLNRGILYDITDMNVLAVAKFGREQVISFGHEDSCDFITIYDFEFVIFKDDQYYQFKTTDKGKFMKWLTAIQLRCKNKAI